MFAGFFVVGSADVVIEVVAVVLDNVVVAVIEVDGLIMLF